MGSRELHEPANAAVQRSDSNWMSSYVALRAPHALIGRVLCEHACNVASQIQILVVQAANGPGSEV